MRVLHVVASQQRRGAEIFAADLIKQLNSRGISQHVAVLRGSDRHSSLVFGAPATVLAPNGRYLPGLRLDREAVRQLDSLAIDWRPDIIQVHGGEPLKHVVLSRRNVSPVVYRRIGSAPRRITRGPSRIAHTYLMRRASRVVVVADALRREAVDTFRIAPGRVVTIQNAVDPDRLRPTASRQATRSMLRIDNHAPVVLSVGALTWEKDPLTHLRVARRLLSDRPDAMHLFVGEGPLRSRLERAILEMALGDRVRVLGAREDVPNLLAAADLMILASRVEGLPGCLIEAGFAGLPVAAFAVAGVPEIIEDRSTGVLIAPGDVDGLADAASRLLADHEAMASMGAKARARSATMFDIGMVAPRYLDLYRQVVQ